MIVATMVSLFSHVLFALQFITFSIHAVGTGVGLTANSLPSSSPRQPLSPVVSAGPALPVQPPFKAYLSNIPFDLDELLVERFFQGLKIIDIVITRHRDTYKPKGCFVEFSTQQDLKNALTFNGKDILRRPVSIQVADPRPQGSAPGGFRQGRGGAGGMRRNDFSSTYERSGPGRRGGGGGGGGGGGMRSYDDSTGSNSRWGREKPDSPPRSPARSPRERPKLILQPRSGSTAETSEVHQGSRPNPFGNARPTDTATKLQELEERLAEQKKKSAPGPPAPPSKPTAILSRAPPPPDAPPPENPREEGGRRGQPSSSKWSGQQKDGGRPQRTRSGGGTGTNLRKNRQSSGKLAADVSGTGPPPGIKKLASKEEDEGPKTTVANIFDVLSLNADE